MSSGFTACVAPKFLARSCFDSTGSTATISAAPAIRAPWIAEIPTPPQPITATDEPGEIAAVLIAAPTPVVTPQPTNETISSGMSGSTFTTAFSGMIISSAKVPSPVIPPICLPSTMKCGVMAICSMVSQRFACPRRHALQVRHAGVNARITGSPAATSVTPAPTSFTIPAPSCPSTQGVPDGIVPFCADTSEWQTPLDTIFTWTSPGPRSVSETSSRTSSSLFRSHRTAAFMRFLLGYGDTGCARSRAAYPKEPEGGKPGPETRTAGWMA